MSRSHNTKVLSTHINGIHSVLLVGLVIPLENKVKESVPSLIQSCTRDVNNCAYTTIVNKHHKRTLKRKKQYLITWNIRSCGSACVTREGADTAWDMDYIYTLCVQIVLNVIKNIQEVIISNSFRIFISSCMSFLFFIFKYLPI